MSCKVVGAEPSAFGSAMIRPWSPGPQPAGEHSSPLRNGERIVAAVIPQSLPLLFSDACVIMHAVVLCILITRFGIREGTGTGIILGIDPGLATVGFGAIRAEKNRLSLLSCGAITTPAGQRVSLRLKQIYDDMLELIDMVKPEAIAMEELFFNTNQTTGIAVAQARGVLILAGQTLQIPMFEYTPLQVKQNITGYGRAQKPQMMEMVRRTLNLDAVVRPDDASDALALAICHARTVSSLMNTAKEDSVCSTI